MSQNKSRSFEARLAVREHTPLLLGLVGPSGSGKTYSALRVASGIQQVIGGEIFGVDTEARRMLHYAERFKFQHVQFDAPFGSLDYLEVLRFCVAQGAKTIIVDSTSHEHEGVGGLLDFQEKEHERLGGSDRVKMLAWVKPKAARRQLINGILQLNANMIFCFRAKSINKPVKGKDGKTEIVPQGFVPIAGDEFIYEMMLNCYLPPKSNGIPKWDALEPGEAMAMKLPEQFRHLFTEPRPLDEEIGKRLAEWAAGSKKEDEVGEWEAKLAKINDVAALNATARDYGRVSPANKQQIWRLMMARATAFKWAWDKDKKKFFAPKQTAGDLLDGAGTQGETDLDRPVEEETRDNIDERIRQLQDGGKLADKELNKMLRDSGIKDRTKMTRGQADSLSKRLRKLEE